MANNPNDPHKLPHDPDIPPEPADLLDLEANTAPTDESLDIHEADLLEFDESPSAFDQNPPGTDSSHALDSFEEAANLPPFASDSSILTGRDTEADADGSGWMDSAVDLDRPIARNPAESEAASSASGVNLHDPDGLDEQESGSSIFGRAATDQSSRIILPPSRDGSDIAAASIWDEPDLIAPTPPDDNPPVGKLDWDAMKGSGTHDPAEDEFDDNQSTLAAPREELIENDLDAWLEEETKTAPKPASKPQWDITAVGMPIGPKAPLPPRKPAPAADSEFDLEVEQDDEPVKATPKRSTPAVEKKAKSGALGWIGGGALGLLLGGGGVFGLSQMGVLPGQEAPKPLVSTGQQTPPAADAGKLVELQKALQKAEATKVDVETKLTSAKQTAKDATDKLTAAMLLADKADADRLAAIMKQTDAEAKLITVAETGRQTALKLIAAEGDLKLAMEKLTKAQSGLTTATKELADVQKQAKASADVLSSLVKEFKAAKLIPADADAATALAKLPDAARGAVSAAVSGDAKKAAEALAIARKELEASQASLKSTIDDLAKAKKATEVAMKAAEDRATELSVGQKQAKASEDVLSSLVKEFKAAKLIPADADAATALAKLPDAARGAVSAAVSGDAKKAAEALAIARKELEANQASLKTTTDELAKAKKAVDVATKVAEARAAELTNAQKQAKASEDLLTGLVKEFKSAKLIPADADAATALAKLPDAARGAVSAVVSGDAKKAAEALAAAKKELESAQAAAKKAETDLVTAEKAAKDTTVRADKAVVAAQAEAAKAVKAAEAAKLEAEKALASAEKDAIDKVKVAEAAKLDAEKALAANKKEADIAIKAAVAKATGELSETLKADAAKSVKAAEAAKVAAEMALAIAKKDADSKLKEAIAKATADSVAKEKAAILAVKVAETNLKAAEAKALAEAKLLAEAQAAAEAAIVAASTTKVEKERLTATVAELTQRLRDVQLNGPGAAPLITPDILTEEKAAAAYTAGVSAYFAGRYSNAEQSLKAATAGAADARYSYYLGLSQLAQGDKAAAAESFTVGAALERRNRPNAREIGEALERIQGPARKELSKYRPR